jgi:hypothetical protein
VFENGVEDISTQGGWHNRRLEEIPNLGAS